MLLLGWGTHGQQELAMRSQRRERERGICEPFIVCCVSFSTKLSSPTLSHIVCNAMAMTTESKECTRLPTVAVVVVVVVEEEFDDDGGGGGGGRLVVCGSSFFPRPPAPWLFLAPSLPPKFNWARQPLYVCIIIMPIRIMADS